jgi:hypothetical protein
LEKKTNIKNKKPDVVAHTYNLSHLEDRDQQDCGLRPAQANGLRYTISSNERLDDVPVIPDTWEA